jgi:hypothetical protein
MTTDKYQLKTRQICLFIIAFLPITKLFMMPSIATKFANEDMWISVFINLLLDFTTIFILTITCRNFSANFLFNGPLRIKRLFWRRIAKNFSQIFFSLTYLDKNEHFGRKKNKKFLSQKNL